MWWTLWRFLTSSSREEERIERDQLRESTEWTRQEMHSCKMSKSANQNKNLAFSRWSAQSRYSVFLQCLSLYAVCARKTTAIIIFPHKKITQQYGKMTNKSLVTVTVHAANIQGRCLKWKSAQYSLKSTTFSLKFRQKQKLRWRKYKLPLHLLYSHLVVCGQGKAIFTLTAKKPFSVCGALVSTNHRRATHGVH